MTPEQFIARWQNASGSELANAQSFVRELTELLELPPPNPAQEDTRDNDYVFERRVIFRHGDGTSSEGRIDCFKRGHFVLEAKKLKLGPQTKGFDDAMLRARSQAENYARALPAVEGRPPFLIVVDVGNQIELFSEFTQSGATYTPFPDPRSHRIKLAELADEKVRARLKAIWLDPQSLDPTRASAKATREIADRLAGIAKALESAQYGPERVAGFLTRCLFSMFAEDVGLLPHRSFSELLDTLSQNPDQFVPLLGALWQEMDKGGFSVVLRETLPRFNGKLFKNPDVLPLNRDQIDLLRQASKADWTQVEPAIFGTLLERALNPDERHALGAHYTPRAYVERLVLPTVIEPLRAEWANVQAAALLLANEAGAEPSPVSQKNKLNAALDELDAFHHRLCQIRVLDPACGSSNFLYVTLEHMKRLEGEVLDFAHLIGGGQQRLEAEGLTVDPHQFLGLELNPRAAAVAELVLWIGYLQWHFRTRGTGLPPQPILKDFRNIECRDAVLAYDRIELVTDEHGKPVTRWDGKTMKVHPVTGEQVPDETARIEVERYVNPRPAEWPAADYIVGNPPFIGASTMRAALGDGYVDALRSVWKDVPDSADFVMFWWHNASFLVRSGAVRRFGFITTNSLRQTFNRRVLELAMAGDLAKPVAVAKTAKNLAPAELGSPERGEAGRASGLAPSFGQRSAASAPHLAASATVERDAKTANLGLHLAFAVPDHPWVDSADGAAVRIAMTVGAPGEGLGRLLTVTDERDEGGEGLEVTLETQTGKLHSDLRIGAEISAAKALRANQNISSPGFKLHGSGFIVSPEEASKLEPDAPIKVYRNGRDLTDRPRDAKLIDLFGLSAEEVRARFPATYQWVLERIKPERDSKAHTPDGAGYAKYWWLFGKPRQELRKHLAGLPRYIATVETAKHRVFQFLDIDIAPDNRLICFALSDGYSLGVFSSVVHVLWALAAGGTLEDRPVYTKVRCFDPFPFPAASPAQQTRIRDLAEHLDGHRKRQQAAHETLTLTGMYNVLAKLRSGEVLNAKEKAIHEMGLVSVLKTLHDELDAAVLDAYGWGDLVPQLGSEAGREALSEILLTRLVALNLERSREEAAGLIRWLRPEYQNPQVTGAAAEPVSDTDARRLSQRDSFQSQKIPANAALALPADDETPEGVAGAAAPPPKPAASEKQAWPSALPEQMAAVAQALATAGTPLSEPDIAARFSGKGPWKKRLPEILQTLVALGRARQQEDHWLHQ
jgi:hypothetical protein